MIRVRVDRQALHRITHALLQIRDLPPQIAEELATRVVIPRLQDYPPQSGKPMVFVSARQRRAFFAKLRAGLITVPYRRTYRLKESWTFARQGRDGGEVTPVGVSYARYVQGKPGQARYHRGNWADVEMIAQEVTPRCTTMTAEILDRELRRIL